MNEEAKGERIAKRLSRAGVCSRREAERMIADGRVSIGGQTIDTPATLVTDADIIAVDGKEIAAPERARLWRYHKAPGILCTNRDPQERPTLFEQLPKDLPRVMLVGRLDFNSEGLILLTNDGALARKLELPETGWVRRYRVRVYGAPEKKALAALADGVTVEGVRYGPIEAFLEQKQARNSWLSVTLREGKNREIRRVMEHIGLKVNRLIRVSYGPFHLGNLARGDLREVPAHVIADQTGAERAAHTRPKPRKRPAGRKKAGVRKHAHRRRNP